MAATQQDHVQTLSRFYTFYRSKCTEKPDEGLVGWMASVKELHDL